MKRLLILCMILASSACSAAITGPYPVGPGVPPLINAVAKISGIDVILFPQPKLIINVSQYVSPEAYAAGIAVGIMSFDISFVDLSAYGLDTLIVQVVSAVENWLIAKILPGWTKL